MKTYATRQKDIKRSWHLINAKDNILGRFASRAASLLIGKHKVYYASNLDVGDFVVIVNAKDVKTTGKKAMQKLYQRHSGFPSGFKQFSLSQMMEKDATQVVRMAVSGMLPKNKLRDKRLARLKIFLEEKHPYEDKFD